MGLQHGDDIDYTAAVTKLLTAVTSAAQNLTLPSSDWEVTDNVGDELGTGHQRRGYSVRLVRY